MALWQLEIVGGACSSPMSPRSRWSSGRCPLPVLR